MKIETSSYGKIATTSIELQTGFEVEALTMKRYSGNLVTTFTLFKMISENCKQTCVNFKSSSVDHGNQRITEKNLTKFHNEALERLGDFKEHFEKEIINFNQ